jgi:hypothetical protein
VKDIYEQLIDLAIGAMVGFIAGVIVGTVLTIGVLIAL